MRHGPAVAPTAPWVLIATPAPLVLVLVLVPVLGLVLVRGLVLRRLALGLVQGLVLTLSREPLAASYYCRLL